MLQEAGELREGESCICVRAWTVREEPCKSAMKLRVLRAGERLHLRALGRLGKACQGV